MCTNDGWALQAVNYGQDYSYMLAADAAFPGFFKGMMVADPAAPNPVQVLTELVSIHPTASLPLTVQNAGAKPAQFLGRC